MCLLIQFRCWLKLEHHVTNIQMCCTISEIITARNNLNYCETMQKFSYLRRHLDSTHSNHQQAVRYRVTLDYNDHLSACELSQ